MYKEPQLCEFTQVKLKVPRPKLIKLLSKRIYLSHQETIWLTNLKQEVEEANFKILHILSIIEKALRKSSFPQR